MKDIVRAPETVDMRAVLLEQDLRGQYMGTEKSLPYHGWQHVTFIDRFSKLLGPIQQVRLNALTEKEWLQYHAGGLGRTIRLNLLKPTALVHDTDKLAEVKGFPRLEGGIELRQASLRKAGYTNEEVDYMENVIQEEESSLDRGMHPKSWSTAILRDAGIINQVHPERKAITSVDAFSKETGEHHLSHAQRIVERTHKWMANMRRLGYEGLFYTEAAHERFHHLVEEDLAYWQNVLATG